MTQLIELTAKTRDSQVTGYCDVCKVQKKRERSIISWLYYTRQCELKGQRRMWLDLEHILGKDLFDELYMKI